MTDSSTIGSSMMSSLVGRSSLMTSSSTGASSSLASSSTISSSRASSVMSSSAGASSSMTSSSLATASPSQTWERTNFTLVLNGATIALEPAAVRSLSEAPAGTATNTLSVCVPLVTMSSREMIVDVPPMLRFIEVMSYWPLFGVTTKCHQAASLGQSLLASA